MLSNLSQDVDYFLFSNLYAGERLQQPATGGAMRTSIGEVKSLDKLSLVSNINRAGHGRKWFGHGLLYTHGKVTAGTDVNMWTSHSKGVKPCPPNSGPPLAYACPVKCDVLIFQLSWI